MEYVGYRKAKAGEYWLIDGNLVFCDNQTIYQYPIFRPVEPPLELETRLFIRADAGLKDHFLIDRNGEIDICVDCSLTPAEARDLAKILNYWAEKRRLPKVKLRGAK